MDQQQETLYVALDVEASGHKLGVHEMLSVGCCAVSREEFDHAGYALRGLLFYAELKPRTLCNAIDAMRVGCLHLECLEELRRQDHRYDSLHARFEPALVLEHMQKVCEEPAAASWRLAAWLKGLRADRALIPVVDTVFFDSGFISLWLAKSGVDSPFGHAGRDLKSVYQGFTRRRQARLEEIRVPRCDKPHKADHDAVELAQKARVLLFENMKW